MQIDKLFHLKGKDCQIEFFFSKITYVLLTRNILEIYQYRLVETKSANKRYSIPSVVSRNTMQLLIYQYQKKKKKNFKTKSKTGDREIS